MLCKLIVMLCLLSSTLMAAENPKPSADALGRWVGGKWVGEAKLTDTNYSTSMAVSGVNTCQWSPDHVFVVCDQAITADGKPDRALSIYAFDPEKSAYHLFGISPKGDRPHVTEVTISPDQSRWEYLGKAEIKDKTVEFRTVNIFHDADHVEWWSEYSTDNGAHWVRTGEGKESRQK